ncbi:MAG: sporulation protein YqfD [Clostridia bacterium]|nr:sporulation protein YqfD [Clostridia bacterium]
MTFFVRLSIQSLSPEVALSKLKREGISLYHVEKSEKNRLYFSIKRKDERKAFAILGNSCYNMKKERSEGWSLFFEHAKKRTGFALGAALLFLAMALLQPMVFAIDLKGEERYRDYAETILAENGVRLFQPYRGDNAYLSARLLQLPAVSFASVKKEGFRLVVEIRSRSQEEIVKKEPLCAAYDGTVETLVVLAGTASVKVGDEVAKGDVLILPTGADGREVVPCAKVSLLCRAVGSREELLLLTEGDYLTMREIDGGYEATFRRIHTITF